MACAPQAVREAQSVVVQADSLWHAGKQYGIDEGDSATLAQACETLGQWQWLHADEYAHACYHYGKLLQVGTQSNQTSSWMFRLKNFFV